MKTYKELTTEQQNKAIQRHINDVLLEIINTPAFFDYNDPLYKKILAASEKAEKMQTPWFFGEYIMETCEKEIASIAIDRAETCLYCEGDKGEVTMSGVA